MNIVAALAVREEEPRSRGQMAGHALGAPAPETALAFRNQRWRRDLSRIEADIRALNLGEVR